MVLEQATRPDVETPMPVTSTPVHATTLRPSRRLRGLVFVAPSTPETALQSLAKRALDLSLALPALIVLGPVMLFVVIAINGDSTGPVLVDHGRVCMGMGVVCML